MRQESKIRPAGLSRGMRKDVREDLEKARSEAASIRSEMERTRREINTEMTAARKEIGREVDQLKRKSITRFKRLSTILWQNNYFGWLIQGNPFLYCSAIFWLPC